MANISQKSPVVIERKAMMQEFSCFSEEVNVQTDKMQPKQEEDNGAKLVEVTKMLTQAKDIPREVILQNESTCNIQFE